MRPVLFKIGTFEVHSFGVVMVVAFFAAIYLVQTRAKRYGLDKNQVGDMTFWALIAGVLGARVVFILQDLDHYMKNWRELLTLQFQGLTSFGGLLFGMGAVMIWAHRKKIPTRVLFDLGAPAFILGHAIGRFGCLLNGCCFGGVCPNNVPWGIHVDGGGVILHHPAQVYDSVMNFAVLGLLLILERKNLVSGRLAALAVALHGLTRFIYEFWRAGTEDQVRNNLASSTYWGNLPITQAQGMALVLVAAGVVGYFLMGRKTVPVEAPVTA